MPTLVPSRSTNMAPQTPDHCSQCSLQCRWTQDSLCHITLTAHYFTTTTRCLKQPWFYQMFLLPITVCHACPCCVLLRSGDHPHCHHPHGVAFIKTEIETTTFVQHVLVDTNGLCNVLHHIQLSLCCAQSWTLSTINC